MYSAMQFSVMQFVFAQAIQVNFKFISLFKKFVNLNPCLLVLILQSIQGMLNLTVRYSAMQFSLVQCSVLVLCRYCLWRNSVVQQYSSIVQRGVSVVSGDSVGLGGASRPFCLFAAALTHATAPTGRPARQPQPPPPPPHDQRR